MTKILFCGYREWALNAYDILSLKYDIDLCRTQDELEGKYSNYDVCILAGWSWLIPKKMLEKTKFFGVHPSDLPNYRGGSPLQNQIIEGITKTKCTLFEITPKLDEGGIVGKINISLEGKMKEIFNELTRCTVELCKNLIQDWPNLKIEAQGPGNTFKRRNPEQSKLDKDLFFSDLNKAYNTIRALGDPYPNAFIEDDKGIIYFKEVEYVKK